LIHAADVGVKVVDASRHQSRAGASAADRGRTASRAGRASVLWDSDRAPHDEAVARPTMYAPDARDRLVDLLAAVSDTRVGDTHVAKGMIDRPYG